MGTGPGKFVWIQGMCVVNAEARMERYGDVKAGRVWRRFGEEDEGTGDWTGAVEKSVGAV